MGGKTAMLFAVTHPQMIAKLMIADISPRKYEPHHNAILAGLNSIDFSIQTTRSLVDAKLAELIPEVGIRQFLLKNVYWIEKGKLAFRFHLASLTANNVYIGEPLPNGTSFEGETLFLKGAKSGYITNQELPIIARHFPNANVLTIANAGHWLHAENPKDFYSAVLNFLTL